MLNKHRVFMLAGLAIALAGVAAGVAGVATARPEWVAAGLFGLFPMLLSGLLGLRQRSHEIQLRTDGLQAGLVGAVAQLDQLARVQNEIQRSMEVLRRAGLDTHQAALDGLRKVHAASGELGALRAETEAAKARQDQGLVALRAQAEQSRAALEALLVKSLAGGLAPLQQLSEGQQQQRAALGSIRERVEKLADEGQAKAHFRQVLAWLKLESTLEVAALLGLQDLLQGRPPLPRMTDFAMEPVAMAAVVDLVRAKPGARVVELGSGASTVALAHAAKACGGSVVSVDHLGQYLDATARELARHPVDGVATLRLATIKPLPGEDGVSWYDTDVIDAIEGPIDVLLIDGPPKAIGAGARVPALSRLADRLADGAWVIVDDANRKDERRMIAMWRERFPALGEPVKISPRTVAMRYGGTEAG